MITITAMIVKITIISWIDVNESGLSFSLTWRLYDRRLHECIFLKYGLRIIHNLLIVIFLVLPENVLVVDNLFN